MNTLIQIGRNLGLLPLHSYHHDDRSYRFKWGELSTKIHGPMLELSQFDHHGHTLCISFIFLTFYIATPRIFKHWECMEHGLGFTFTKESLHISFGKKTRCFYYPWTYQFYKRWEWVEGIHWNLNSKGGFDDCGDWIEIPRNARHGVLATKHEAPYTYTLKSGEVQNRKATYSVDRMEWRWRILPFSPWPTLRRDCIDVKFDDEVGERSGSWKGGAIGCDYEMKPGEKPLETLRRMEIERKFT